MRRQITVLFASLALMAATTQVSAAQGLVIAANPGPDRDKSRPTKQSVYCFSESGNPKFTIFTHAFFVTGYSDSEDWKNLREQWGKRAISITNDPLSNTGCTPNSSHSPGVSLRDYLVSSFRSRGLPFSEISWSPNESDSEVRRKSVYFRQPNVSLFENGYAGISFDIEYKFIVCDQELHIAYSVVDDSSKAGEYGFVPSYWFGPRGKIRVYKTEVPLPKINNLPLEIVVWKGSYTTALARLSDVQASRALALTCFAGQTQKVAMLKDYVPKPTPETLTAFLNSLNASFETSMILTSAAAEQEIEAGIRAGDGTAAREEAAAAEARKAAAEAERTARLNREVAERDAAINQRNAEIKAADERRQREYLEALAAQKAEADRIKREDAAARARYEADMAAWRARVAACNAGVVSQCQ